MSLRPPSSPSPSPGPNENGKANARQSMGPQSRGTPGLPPSSPRPGARPTSELLGGSGMFQTPEAEALDQWFENLQSYEVTLEEMAAASLDVNFKEELSAIEQWFKVLSEAERTAALYSLLQHSTQVQIRFFITVLQQMARSDPMTALLSPAMGGSMQSQMESKLASLKSPGLKSSFPPASPTARNFTANRQSLALDSTTASNFLSPDSAATASKEDAAATLAQQRAKFKATNAAHRISAPVSAWTAPGSTGGAAGGSSQLSQVAEQNSAPPQEVVVNASARPKSTEFAGSPRPTAASNNSSTSNNEVTISPDNSWASMVNTPLIPMFGKGNDRTNAHALDNKSNDFNGPKSGPPGVPRMGDPTIHRRGPKSSVPNGGDAIYDDNGNLISSGQQQQQQQGRFRNPNMNGNNFGGGAGAGWSGARSPALSNTSSNRFDDNNNNMLANMQMAAAGFGMGPMGSPNLGMGMGGMPNLNIPGVNPFNMNMNMLSAMGITPETLIAAQMAAATGQFGQPGGWLGGMQPPNSGGLGSAGGRRGVPTSGRSPALKSAGSIGSSGGTPKAEDDVDPALLNDIPAWLRSLRLHKYTPNFEGMKWQDMVVLDEAALEAHGVAALGARRKMLKTFELVRKKMGIEGGPPSLPPSATVKSP